MLCVAMAVVAALGATAEGTTLYVATDGNNAWSGARPEPNADGTDGPLASLAGARDALRGLRAAGEVAGPAADGHLVAHPVLGGCLPVVRTSCTIL